MSTFKTGQFVETTRKLKFGHAAHIPKNTRGKVVEIKGVFTKKYGVEFTHGKYGRIIITAEAGYFRGTYSF
jgi:hypothetical protein